MCSNISTFNDTLQALAAAADQQNNAWDLVVATFSLQNIPPPQLPQLLQVPHS